MAEVIISTSSDSLRVKSGTVVDTAAAATGNKSGVMTNTNPGACLSNVSGKEYNLAVIQGTPLAWKGNRWPQGIPPYTSFSTLLPPNGPSCTSGDGDVAARVFNTASSNHTGGVQVVMADGAVQFASETVGTGSLLTGGKLKDSGKTEFGIWGALGSIKGGDQGSL
jgi:hypothetical protein